MTDEKKGEEQDEDDSMSLSLGFFKMKLSGAHLGQFLPWVGWTLIILAVAYAISLLMESYNNGSRINHGGTGVVTKRLQFHFSDDDHGANGTGTISTDTATKPALRRADVSDRVVFASVARKQFAC